MTTRADKYYILSPVNHVEKWVEHNGKFFAKSCTVHCDDDKVLFLNHVVLTKVFS